MITEDIGSLEAIYKSQQIDKAKVQNVAIGAASAASDPITTRLFYMSATDDCWVDIDKPAVAGSAIFMPKGLSYIFKADPGDTVVHVLERSSNLASFLSIVEMK